MSDVWQGPGWWLASDGKWYPADAEPGAVYEGDLSNTDMQQSATPVATDVAEETRPDATEVTPAAEVDEIATEQPAVDLPKSDADPFAQLPAPGAEESVDVDVEPGAVDSDNIAGWQAVTSTPEPGAAGMFAGATVAGAAVDDAAVDEAVVADVAANDVVVDDGWTSAYEERQATSDVLDEHVVIESVDAQPLAATIDLPNVDLPSADLPSMEAPGITPASGIDLSDLSGPVPDISAAALDAAVLDADVVDAAVLDPDVLDADFAIADVQAPEEIVPDVLMPDVAIPDVAIPDVAIPDVIDDVSMPDMEIPDIAAPDVTIPDASMPDMEIPDIAAPDVTMPDMEIPDIAAPDVTIPDASMPDMEIPETVAPDLSIPDLSIPDMAIDDVDVVDVDLGDMADSVPMGAEETLARVVPPPIEREDAWRKPLASESTARPSTPSSLSGTPDVVDLAIRDEPMFTEESDGPNWRLIGGVLAGIVAICAIAWLIATLFSGNTNNTDTSNDSLSSSTLSDSSSSEAPGSTADPATESSVDSSATSNTELASVFDLRAGDCIIGDIGAGQVTKVQKVDCDIEHQFEVYREALIDTSITAFDADAISSYAEEVCRTSLAAYVPPEDDRGLKFKFLQPTEDSWNQEEVPDRVITCLLFDDDAPLVGRAA